MSLFAGYLLGLLVLVAGLAVAAFLLNVPTGAIVVVVLLVLFGLGAWVTRQPRARPSKFTGATPNAPSLDRTVLMELKTMLMEKVDAARTNPTTRMPSSEAPGASDSRSQPTTRIEQQTSVSKRPKPTPPND